MGWGGTSLSLAPRGEIRRQRAGGDRLWGDQSAPEESERLPPARLPTSPLAHRKSLALPARCHLRRRCMPGPYHRCSPGFGGPQWRSPRFDGLAQRSQCDFPHAAFLRASRGSLLFTASQAFAVERVHQKALDISPKDLTKVEDRHTLGAQKNKCTNEEPTCMGQAIRTTKLLIDLGERTQGAANTRKRAYLEETAKILDAAHAFYVAFFLAHPEKLTARVTYFSDRHHQERERLISPNELLT